MRRDKDVMNSDFDKLRKLAENWKSSDIDNATYFANELLKAIGALENRERQKASIIIPRELGR